MPRIGSQMKPTFPARCLQYRTGSFPDTVALSAMLGGHHPRRQAARGPPDLPDGRREISPLPP
jgi:hypothetical protein